MPVPDLHPRDRHPAAVAADGPGVRCRQRATELAILDALRSVVDPEIGMNVVELALISQIILGARQPKSR